MPGNVISQQSGIAAAIVLRSAGAIRPSRPKAPDTGDRSRPCTPPVRDAFVEHLGSPIPLPKPRHRAWRETFGNKERCRSRRHDCACWRSIAFRCRAEDRSRKRLHDAGANPRPEEHSAMAWLLKTATRRSPNCGTKCSPALAWIAARLDGRRSRGPGGNLDTDQSLILGALQLQK
jgi:hypothetical protein